MSGGGALADGLADWITPGRTALVVIDMQIDFASPEGAVAKSGADLSAVPAALDAAQLLAEGARAAGVTVIFLGLQTDPASDSPAWREWVRRRGGDADVELGLCRAGSHGAMFTGPTPHPGETVVAKTRYSGFFGTDLDGRLKSAGADTLVICGLTTECCVESTARDAFHLDYHVFVVADACATYDASVHAAALRAMERNFAILAASEEVVSAWRSGSNAPAFPSRRMPL
jgi:nicotinamidase-related amidase